MISIYIILACTNIDKAISVTTIIIFTLSIHCLMKMLYFKILNTLCYIQSFFRGVLNKNILISWNSFKFIPALIADKTTELQEYQ